MHFEQDYYEDDAKHYHTFTIDGAGNGKSDSTSNGEAHTHEVKGGVVQPAGKHEHSHKTPYVEFGEK